MHRAHAIAALAIASLTGCPSPRHPQDRSADPSTLEIGRDATSIRGVTGDGAIAFVARAAALGTSAIEARRGATLVWAAKVGGTAGPLALGASTVFAALAGTGTMVGATSPTAALRGEPAAVVDALDAASGAIRWRTAFESSEWAQVSSLAGLPDGVIVGGTFVGTLRVGASVVSSAGKSDGFVARLDASGKVGWLVRVGGLGADAVQGVAARDGRIAIAGTFTAGAELHGTPLLAFDEKSPFGDAFVAELDARGGRTWSASFGGKLDDSVAGVAIDASGRVAVAANARDTMHVAGADLVAQGDADGLVGWWTRDGTATHAVLIGGTDFDGLRAITSVGDRIVVAGFFSGALTLGDRMLHAGGGDDAFVVALDDHGAVLESWQVGGPGREEITALAAIPGGFLAAVAHTAAADVAGAALPSPKDPMSGAALVVRAVH